MQLDEAKRILKNAGLIAEEMAEDDTARMAANRYEGQVDEIVDEIEKVKHVKLENFITDLGFEFQNAVSC